MTTSTTPELTWEQRVNKELKERIERMGGLDAGLRSKIVSVRAVESQYEAYQLGMEAQKIKPARYHIEKELLPEEVIEALGSSWSRYTAAVVLPQHHGQGGGGGDNVLLIVEPYWGTKSGKLVKIEIGCAHEMKTVRKGNCYYKSACAKCGFWYEVDSSD